MFTSLPLAPCRLIFTLFCFFILGNTLGQNRTTDSLYSEFKKAGSDTLGLRILTDIGLELLNENPDSALKMYEHVAKLALQKLANKKNTPKIQNSYMHYYATALSNMGFIYNDQGALLKALENFHKCLGIFEKLKEESNVGVTYVNIGLVYNQQEEYQSALEFYGKGLKVLEKIKDQENTSNAINNIGAVYYRLQDFDKALEIFNKGLKIKEGIRDSSGISLFINNIGFVYFVQKKFDKALENFNKSLGIAERRKEKTDIALALNNIAQVYRKQKKYDKALEYSLKAMEISKQIGYPEKIRNAAKTLRGLYVEKNDYKKALEMTDLYYAMRDSITNKELRQTSFKKQVKFDYERKAAEVRAAAKAEKEKIELKAAEDKKRQTLIIYSVIAGLIIVSVFSLFIYRGLQENKKANKIIVQQKLLVEEKNHHIEEKQKEIIDSINYAQRIQRSLLASTDLLNNSLIDYFILFKPKDIVSGDFYWAAKLKNDHFALVTADSTGHGVPGAIMSMLNIACLNEAIGKGHTMPNDILFETRIKIIEHLKNDGSAEGGKDGMDCSLICLDFKSNTLYASAANNPVWIIRQKEIIEIKPDKMPVGKHDKDQIPFTLHTIRLEKGDVIYALTDGFPDQFGGPKGKKFMSKNLKDLLLANSHLPLAEQKQLLDEAFTNWTGNVEQIDDVSIIGIKI